MHSVWKSFKKSHFATFGRIQIILRYFLVICKHCADGASSSIIVSLDVRILVVWFIRLNLCAIGCFSPLQSLSLKIEDDLRKSKNDPLSREPESEVARRAAERRLFGSTGLQASVTQSDRIRQEMQRYASMRDPSLREYPSQKSQGRMQRCLRLLFTD